ncbi:MAG: GNAT family N-acetyltransferase [Acidimicrobiales bacterium]|jgi:GNAT superfamily N-acetyltransferase|nr:GNAT family N-acetyltransferase [Acidimicrobiales bacterium]
MDETAGVLRAAASSDLDLVVDIWTDAFAADPFLRWVQPADDDWPRFAAARFALVVEHAWRVGELDLIGTDDGAVAWLPPGAAPAVPADADRLAALLVEHAGDRRGRHALAAIGAARAALPDEAHRVLRYVGVRARHQGRGLGALLVTPGLRRCDADGTPTALVSSNPANLGFYRRSGFEVVAEVWTPDGRACLHTMVRAPGRPSTPVRPTCDGPGGRRPGR